MKDPVKYLLSLDYDRVEFEHDPGAYLVTVYHENQEIAFSRSEKSYHQAATGVLHKLGKIS